MEKFITQFETTGKKMISLPTRFRENDDLPLWRNPAVKKKPPFFNVSALITRELMRSTDAQFPTEKTTKYRSLS